MSWVLALSLYSNPNGLYTQEFISEQQCVVEMRKTIKKLEKGDTKNVKMLACVPKDSLDD